MEKILNQIKELEAKFRNDRDEVLLSELKKMAREKMSDEVTRQKYWVNNKSKGFKSRG